MEKQLSGGESDQGWDVLFIAVKGGSRAVWGGWPIAVVWIQCFSFSSRGRTMEQSIAERWSRGIELILDPWEGSVTWCGDVGRRRGGTEEGKGRRWHLLGWRKSYWAKKWRKFMRSIQLLQMDGKDLNELCVNLFFLKKIYIYANEI
jgi:hypothetical protein